MKAVRKKVTKLLVGDKPSRLMYWCRIITLLPVLAPYVYGCVLFDGLKRLIDFFASTILDSHFKEFFASRQQSEAPCRAVSPNPPKVLINQTERRRVQCRKAPPI
jgi:hypothetical protein